MSETIGVPAAFSAFKSRMDLRRNADAGGGVDMGFMLAVEADAHPNGVGQPNKGENGGYCN